MKLVSIAALITALSLTSAAHALDRPWISDVFFYWYLWDYETEKGSWIGGVYNTPLVGYYDSRSYEDNLRQLHMASEYKLWKSIIYVENHETPPHWQRTDHSLGANVVADGQIPGEPEGWPEH